MRGFVPNVVVTHPLVPDDNLRLYDLMGGLFGKAAEAAALGQQIPPGAPRPARGRSGKPPQRALFHLERPVDDGVARYLHLGDAGRGRLADDPSRPGDPLSDGGDRAGDRGGDRPFPVPDRALRLRPRGYRRLPARSTVARRRRRWRSTANIAAGTAAAPSPACAISERPGGERPQAPFVTGVLRDGASRRSAAHCSSAPPQDEALRDGASRRSAAHCSSAPPQDEALRDGASRRSAAHCSSAPPQDEAVLGATNTILHPEEGVEEARQRRLETPVSKDEMAVSKDRTEERDRISE